MATLVLTTAGTLVGGPVGGALGALIGNRIDGGVLGGGRRGPRLADLSVQTSAYGSAIPQLFGRIRVAGTVIWATDLKESSTRSGGSKGRAATTQYSYSASFAVALSARPVLSIGRIWADGLLLRGAAGDWKGTTGFRLHRGGEAQAADPLIAAVEGIAQTPAYRGIAYAVFEDLQLAPYGNRIPSITFEVVADADPVTIGAVAAAVSDGDIADATVTTLIGHAAGGDSVRDAVEVLAAAVPSVLIDGATGLVLREGGTEAATVPDAALGAAAGADGGVRHAQDRRAAGTVPDLVTIAYHEVDRDYQLGSQRAGQSGTGRRVLAIELPAVLSADAAKGIAERRLAADRAARHTALVRLPWRWMATRPGAALHVAGLSGDWRVAGVTIDRMVVELRLVAVPGGGRVAAAGTATAGRAVVQVDRPHGPTTLAVFELPAGVPGIEADARMLVAAAGASPGWRQAMLAGSVDGGATVVPIGRTAPPATIGRIKAATPPAGSALFDLRTAIEVVLANDAMALEGRTDAAMLTGANLALVGDELIQFGHAEQVGTARFRLTRLLRGRHGTEAAIATHGRDESFVLIEPDRLAAMAFPAASVGSAVTIMAGGIGDDRPVEVARTAMGLALRPPPPVHLRAARIADGTIRLHWTRRSRAGWSWPDGVDVPLGEETERYRLTIRRGDAVVRAVTVDRPEWSYAPADQDADGQGRARTLDFAVAQLGTAGVSIESRAVVRP